MDANVSVCACVNVFMCTCVYLDFKIYKYTNSPRASGRTANGTISCSIDNLFVKYAQLSTTIQYILLQSRSVLNITHAFIRNCTKQIANSYNPSTAVYDPSNTSFIVILLIFPHYKCFIYLTYHIINISYNVNVL